MWELDCEESWVPKNWCFWTVVLGKTLESPLDYKEIQPVHSKGDQSWVFFRRTDAKAETPVLWSPHAKSWLIGKDSDAGRDWGQEEKGITENEMAGRHHQLDGHEFEWTPGVGEGQGGLACCNSWGCKESDTTERLNWTEWHMTSFFVIVCCLSSLVKGLFKCLAVFKIELFSYFWVLKVFCLDIDISPFHIDNIVDRIIMKHFSSCFKVWPRDLRDQTFYFPLFSLLQT